MSGVPDGEPIAVAFSGGIDSTAVLLLARRACARTRPQSGSGARLHARPRRRRRCGAGRACVPRAGPRARAGSGSTRRRTSYDLEAAIRLIEDYHPLDVECAAAALCLLRGIRQRYPRSDATCSTATAATRT